MLPFLLYSIFHPTPLATYLLSLIGIAQYLQYWHKDGDMIESSRIYVAPPDHHMLIENNRILVKKGPKENRFRPSIDALFRSAAYVYGSRVIGIVLSGLLDDGTSGLWSIRRLHGLCIIQSPEDAEFPSMPNNVLEYVDVDYNVSIQEMGPLLHRLTQEQAPELNSISEEELSRLRMEVQIAAQDNAFNMGVLDLGPYTPYTCPECHGTLVQIEEGMHKRFRCHTGHSFTSFITDGWYYQDSGRKPLADCEGIGRSHNATGTDGQAIQGSRRSA
jgi:two-component system chemotaxis response regulator CheB